MKIVPGFTANRKQRQAIKKIEKLLDHKIIPIMEAAQLPPFIIEKECCPIHTIEFSFSKVEKLSEFDQFMQKTHEEQGIH